MIIKGQGASFISQAVLKFIALDRDSLGFMATQINGPSCTRIKTNISEGI